MHLKNVGVYVIAENNMSVRYRVMVIDVVTIMRMLMMVIVMIIVIRMKTTAMTR
mgnify:CR=1 FL=1